MEIIKCEQGSPEWFAAKLGMVSASHFKDVLAKGTGKTRRAYMMRLAAERLTGEQQPSYSNDAMEWGIETEPLAREYYEQLNSCFVQQVGFCKVNEWLGFSPDGFVGEKGGWETKSPYSTTHLETILSDKMPTCYIPQVQGSLGYSDREWWDFTSFDPRVKQRPYFCKRIYRDEKYIENLKSEVDRFIDQLQDMIKQFTNATF